MAVVFAPHGQFSLHRDGSILVTTLRGPWNIELVQLWAKAALPYSVEMQATGSPWGGVAIITDSMLCTPEAMLALRKIVAFGVQTLGCISQVVVAAPGVTGRGIVESAFQQVYEGLCLSNFFDDYESAREWTYSQISLHNQIRSAE
jgi:hypothetical protein